MKEINIKFKKSFCPNCGTESTFVSFHHSFCSRKECYEDRLRKSGAIDLRDNIKITDLENGFSKIEPIDPNKKF